VADPKIHWLSRSELTFAVSIDPSGAVKLSVQPGILRQVIDAEHALRELEEWKERRGPLLSTGFPVIDQCTEGLDFGQVWVIVSPPGHGRSTLTLNLAATLADSGVATEFLSLRDSLNLVSARLLAARAKVPIHRLLRDEAEGDDGPRLHAAVTRLRELPLRIAYSTDAFDASRSARNPRAYVVDDFDRSSFRDLHTLKANSERGGIIIVSMPRHIVLTDRGVEPGWAAVADVIIDVSRPDAEGCGKSMRPGEADLRLVRNRMGPQTILSVSFQGHYARFSPMAI